jgi:cobalt-zinc-cadmium efflux system outer membrane protein
VGVAILCGSAPLWSQTLTFHELLAKAEQNNQDVEAVRQRAEEAKGALRQAGIRPAPTLNASGTTGRPLGTVGEEQFSAGLSKTLETGDKRTRRMEVAEKQVSLATAEYDERVRQLRFELRLRYAEFIGESARVAVVSELIQTLRQSLDLTRARVERGDAATLDANMLVVEVSRAEAQQVSARGRLSVAQTELGRLAGLGAGEQLALDSASSFRLTLTRDVLTSRALAERPDLRTLRLQEEQGNAGQRLAEAEGHANITVSASYGYVKSRMDDQFGVNARGIPVAIRDRDDVLSVGISIPLFAKNRNQGDIEASVARTRGVALRKEYLEKSIPLEIESALRRYESAENVVQVLSGVATTQAEANLEVIRQAYQLGQMRLLDVLSEQRRLLDTRLARADATSETLRSLAELERAVGGELQ